MGFVVSLVEDLLQGLTPKNYENVIFSPVSGAVPVGVLRQSVLKFNTLLTVPIPHSNDKVLKIYTLGAETFAVKNFAIFAIFAHFRESFCLRK